MKKRTFVLFMSAAVCASMLAGCGNENKQENTPQTQAKEQDGTEQAEPTEAGEPAADMSDPIAGIAGNYYSYYYYPDVDFLMDYFFHFYDEVPGIGKVFYAGFCLNQITFSGTYEVVEEPIDYACWPDRETEEAAKDTDTPPTGTAPYTIHFYDFDGNLLDSCGYDGNNLYMDMENITGTGTGANVFALDTDPENSVMAEDYGSEAAIPVMSFVSPDDETATLELLVNGKYNDMVIMAANGTYSMNTDKSEITLTADSGETAAVTLNEDGSYTYRAADGTEVALAAVGQKAAVSYTFKGEVAVPGMEDTMGDLICEFYEDGSTRVYASAMGAEFDLDAGTYDVDMETYTITAHFDKAGDIATRFTEETMALDYVQAGAEVFGDVEVTLLMVQE